VTRGLTLRAFTRDDLEVLWREQTTDRGRHWVVRPATHEERQRLETSVGLSGSWHDGVLDLALDVDGELVGDLQARNGGLPGVYELGVELFPRHRGKGYGLEAIARITRRLFEREGAHRVQITTDVDNVEMRRVAERLGFVLEGVMRGFMPAPPALPAGSPRDYAMYALTTTDYDEVNSTWT
jgi:RimJ/RimL family protein N-acetyltransferase